MGKPTTNTQCNICDKNFKTKNLLQKHLINIHDEEKGKMNKCDICYKVLKGSLKFHKNRVHQKKKPSNCESCGKSFPCVENLKRHIYTVHEGHKDYKCESCGKSFS